MSPKFPLRHQRAIEKELRILQGLLLRKAIGLLNYFSLSTGKTNPENNSSFDTEGKKQSYLLFVYSLDRLKVYSLLELLQTRYIKPCPDPPTSTFAVSLFRCRLVHRTIVFIL